MTNLSNIQAAILNCADRAYNDGAGDLVNGTYGGRGDGLADFIAQELREVTHRRGGSDAVQKAYDAMRRAAYELDEVAKALDGLCDDLHIKE